MNYVNGKTSRRFALAALPAIGFVLILNLFIGCGGSSGKSLAADGLEAMRQTRYDLAARRLQQALRYHPDSPDLHYNLATAYWMAGKLDAAVEALDMGLALKADDRDALLLKGHLFLRQHNWNEARLVFEQAVERFGMEADVLTSLALAEIGADRIPLARLYLRDALETDPDYPAALYNMGSIMRDHLQQPAKAFEYFNRFCLVADKPEYLSKAQASMERLRQYNAVEDPVTPRNPPESDPDDGSVPEAPEPEPPPIPSRPEISPALDLVERARLEINRDAPPERVLALLKQAIDADPDYPDALWQLAREYERQGLQLRSLEQYQRFAERFPEDPRVRNIPSQFRPGTEPPAVSVLQREARENQRFASLVSEARNQYQRNEWDAAAKSYQEALVIRPDNAALYYNLGRCYKEAGASSKAVQAFSKASELDSDNVDFAYMHAMILREFGRPDPAGVVMESILRTHPEFYRGHLLMAYIRWDQRRNDEVRNHLKQYIALTPPGPQRQKVENWLNNLP